jgi:TorA maturation chaperone TorD
MSADARAEGPGAAAALRPSRRDLDTALARSALFEAAALGFGPPSAASVARLASRGGAEGLVAAAAYLDAALIPLVEALAETDTDVVWLEHQHRRLFGHTVRGEVPAYETEYGGDDLFRQPHELADVGGFYAAFGLTLAVGAGERADHVRCECEFLAFLARREAVALERGEPEVATEIRKATRLFLRDHLGRFAPTLAQRLCQADGGGFYAALGALLDALVHLECARVAVPLGPAALSLRTPIEDRIPMACGDCPLGGGDGADGD